MLRITSFCLLVILQVVTSEPPLHCGRPPLNVNPTECCDFPSIFKEEDFKECGIEKHNDKDGNSKPGPPDCTKQICLLKKYNLMQDDTKVDMDAVGKFMDNFAETNPDFKDAVDKAKERCLNENLPRPPHICQPSAMVFCITKTMVMECPKWNDTEDCKKLKEHFDACKSRQP